MVIIWINFQNLHHIEMASMKSGGSGTGNSSISYQPKKLLKLPKEVPSNIVSNNLVIFEQLSHNLVCCISRSSNQIRMKLFKLHLFQLSNLHSPFQQHSSKWNRSKRISSTSNHNTSVTKMLKSTSRGFKGSKVSKILRRKSSKNYLSIYQWLTCVFLSYYVSLDVDASRW